MKLISVDMLDEMLIDAQEKCKSNFQYGVLSVIRENIRSLPTIDRSGTGHWVVLNDCSNTGVYCSECHIKVFGRYPMKKKLSQYCPHCGAKMEEKVEER